MRLVEGVAVLALMSGAAGCKDDCSDSRLAAMESFTTLLVAQGEGAVDGRYRPTIEEWKALASECRFPKAEVESVRAALEAADADKRLTAQELAPILREIGKMVSAMTGAPVPPEAVASCTYDKGTGLADLPSDLLSDGLKGTKSTREAAKKTDDLSLTADENLFALGQAEIAYYDREKRFVTFTKGTPADWKTLGVKLPAPARHSFRASVKGDTLSILAEGNLDKDDFVDRWLLQYNGKDRCPSATVLAVDALNATFEGKPTGNVPYLIVPQGKPQPRLAELE